MELINKLTLLLNKWSAEFITLSGGFQFVTILACGTLAWFTHTHWQKFISKLQVV